MFATGMSSPPVVCFDPNPSTKFIHDEMKFIPSVHTCGSISYLYVDKKTVTGPVNHYVLTALMNGGVFSKL